MKPSRRHRWPMWLFAGSALLPAALAGCQQKMARQPSYKPLEPAPFFANGMSARPLPAGTVARGHLRVDNALYTGRRFREGQAGQRAAAVVGGAARGILGGMATSAAEYADFVDTFPFPVTRETVAHGRDRYMIYCVVCHDVLGTGRGKIVERGYTPPASFHIDRLRQVPVGHIFAVITEGYGSMPTYGHQIPPRDRWAIVAYLRALQLSQHFPEAQLPPELRDAWAKQPKDAAAGGPAP